VLVLQTVVSVLTANPEAAVALGVVLRLARAYQTELTWPEYRAIHRAKVAAVPLLQRLGVGETVLLVTPGYDRDHPAFVATVPDDLRTTARELRDAGGSLHLICSLKRWDRRGESPFSAAHVVWTVGDEQVEAILFSHRNGMTSVFTHTETAIDDPVGHLTDGVDAGDEYDVLPRLTGE